MEVVAGAGEQLLPWNSPFVAIGLQLAICQAAGARLDVTIDFGGGPLSDIILLRKKWSAIMSFDRFEKPYFSSDRKSGGQMPSDYTTNTSPDATLTSGLKPR